MKPAWDKLMKSYKDSTTALVADVDCTSDGKQLCEDHGIEGFPTIKWGEADDLQDYEGEREFNGLRTFASKNLKPQCSINNIDLCDEKKKEQISGMQAMSEFELTEFIDNVDEQIAAANKEHEEIMEKLNAQIEENEQAQSQTVKQLKQNGFQLAKAIRLKKFGIKYVPKVPEGGDESMSEEGEDPGEEPGEDQGEGDDSELDAEEGEEEAEEGVKGEL